MNSILLEESVIEPKALPWDNQPCRLWSLWDMVFTFNNSALIKLVNTLHQNIDVYSPLGYEGVSESHKDHILRNAEIGRAHV